MNSENSISENQISNVLMVLNKFWKIIYGELLNRWLCRQFLCRIPILTTLVLARFTYDHMGVTLTHSFKSNKIVSLNYGVNDRLIFLLKLSNVLINLGYVWYTVMIINDQPPNQWMKTSKSKSNIGMWKIFSFLFSL